MLKLIDGSPKVWIGSTTVGTEKVIRPAGALEARELAAALGDPLKGPTISPAAAAPTIIAAYLRIPPPPLTFAIWMALRLPGPLGDGQGEATPRSRAAQTVSPEAGTPATGGGPDPRRREAGSPTSREMPQAT